MKKYLLTTVLLFAIGISATYAQHITIPDANLRAALKTKFPSAFNVNDEMNTTDNSITSTTSLVLYNQNISDVGSVIQYFRSLKHLNIAKNNLSTLTSLPSTLNFLYCYNNQLTSLPTLPNALTYLECGNNELEKLPSLPSGLKELHCYNNNLISLPNLPNTLTTLMCYKNSLTSLPTLPNSLIEMYCHDNTLTTLPNLPNGLKYLQAPYNCFTTPPTNTTTASIVFVVSPNSSNCPITALNENESSPLSIYPNPTTTGELTINLGTNNATVGVFNLDGTYLTNIVTSYANTTAQLTLPDTKGMYLIRISELNGEVSYHKVVKE